MDVKRPSICTNTLAAGYPPGLTRIVQLADGTSVLLRPICADDAAAEPEPEAE